MASRKISSRSAVKVDPYIVQGGHTTPNPAWVGVDDVKMLGFERVQHVAKSSYRDNSMVVIVPSRTPFLHIRFVQALNSLQWSMNGKRSMFFVTNAEVGMAYSEQIADVLAHPDLGQWKYVLSIEDDNLPPPEGVALLLEAIEAGPFDGVGGLYFTKGELNHPMCYGDPSEYARTGVLDFRPRDVASAVSQGGIVPCNGIANGFSLFRMQMFRDVPAPWFVTSASGTQDLAFCSKAVSMGKRFATDCRCRVGHADWENNVVY